MWGLRPGGQVSRSELWASSSPQFLSKQCLWEHTLHPAHVPSDVLGQKHSSLPEDAVFLRCWGPPLVSRLNPNSGVADDSQTLRCHHMFHQLMAQKDRVPLSNSLLQPGE